MTGKLNQVVCLAGGEWLCSFTTRDDPGQIWDDLKEIPVRIEISKASKHRSLSANNFCWALIDKIAEKTGINQSEVYRTAIREIGGVSETVCVQDKAVDRLCSGWEKNGIGWQTDTMPSKIPGCTNVILYYGSSTYDTAQMSRLLDLIIQECEQQGIPTLRDEATELLGKWGKDDKKHCPEG